jgi:hypothetical protein
MKIDSAERSTPSAVRRELARYGGLNQYARAHWRIVLSEERLVRRGGVFREMPSGEVEQFQIADGGRVQYTPVKPERERSGYFDVPKYAVRGWILERWFPASMYGDRASWESVKSSDGVTPMMGPYPSEGEYFMLAGPWAKIPEMADLKTAIAMHIRMEEANPVSYEQRLLEEIHADLDLELKQYEKVMSDVAHFYETEVEPVMRGTSLAAGRIRNELAAMTGDRTHQGVI